MAVTEKLTKRTARMLLFAGHTASGATKTTAVNYGQLNPAAWDAQKALNIAIAADAVFVPERVGVETVATSSISNE